MVGAEQDSALLMLNPHAFNVPVSPPAMSLTVSVHTPLPGSPLKVESRLAGR
jgi:hypothetical protein